MDVDSAQSRDVEEALREDESDGSSDVQVMSQGAHCVEECLVLCSGRGEEVLDS